MKIVVLDGKVLNPGDLSWEELEELGEVEIYDRTSKEEILDRCKDAEVLITNKTPLRKEILSQLPRLKYIGLLSTGYDVVDVDFAKETGIIVTNIPAYGTDAVAQMTFALLLELCNHVREHSDGVMRGQWQKSKDFSYWDNTLVELSGKTMGLIGFGRIGIAAATIAKAFGMKVLVYSRTIKDEYKNLVTFCGLEEVLKNSDVVSLHVPLNEETNKIINKDTLALMKKSAFLINTSRGKLIDEKALKEALNNCDIAAAAVDVLSTEPPALDNPLIGAKNIIITPHIAWAAKEARERLLNIAVGNLKSFLAGNTKNLI